MRAWALLLIILSSPSLSALESDRQQPVNIDAGRTVLDNRGEGYYELDDGVSLTQGSLVIKASRARVYGRFGQTPQRIRVQGSPATMQQELDDNQGLVRAQAEVMEFFRDQERVVLTGNVVITQQRGQMLAQRVVYHIADGRIESDAGDDDDRIRMRIDPEAVSQIDGEDAS
jgi:lipopolysaccharide export system protein LptA